MAERKKRSRDEHHRDLNNPSLKKIHVDLEPSSSSHSNDSPTKTTGVFDFPWMNQGAIKSELKFDDDEDAFGSSLHAANVSEIFNDDDDDDRLIVTTTTTEGFYDTAAMRRKEVVNDVDDDGLDCVWDSLLNQQPLSNIEF